MFSKKVLFCYCRFPYNDFIKSMWMKNMGLFTVLKDCDGKMPKAAFRLKTALNSARGCTVEAAD